MAGVDDNNILREETPNNNTSNIIRVLAVDDEEINLDILKKHLDKAGYDAKCMINPAEAWKYLQDNPYYVDVIVLDKMMPEIDGFELLRRIKEHKDLRNKPVIMQTAASSKEDVVKGIELGAYYYITKPYAAEILISVVNSAAKYSSQQKDLSTVEHKDGASFPKHLITNSTLELRTISEAQEVASFLSTFTNDPSRKIVAIMALLSNAIEHGNLEIGYERKSELLTNGKLDEEISRRLNSPEYSGRKVRVSFTRNDQYLRIYIKDEGQGFNWEEYIDFEPRRMTDPNGRGIALANITEHKGLQYMGKGNELNYSIKL